MILDAGLPPFNGFGIVPITVSRQSEDLSFTSKVFEAKAVAQILASNLRTLRFLRSAKSQWRVLLPGSPIA